MAQTITIGNQRLKAGDNLSSALTVPAGFSGYFLQMDTTAWTAADTISLQAEFSADGFATWTVAGSATGNGGTHTLKDGTSSPYIGIASDFPPGATQARVRMTVPSAGNTSGLLTLS